MAKSADKSRFDDIVNAISDRTGEPKTRIRAIINAYLDELYNEINNLSVGEKMRIGRLGTFYIRMSKPRQRRDPRTGKLQTNAAGEVIMTEEREVVKFRINKSLKL